MRTCTEPPDETIGTPAAGPQTSAPAGFTNHQKGFEFLRKTAIDQHINARNRWDDLIPVIQKMPHLLGLG